MRCAPARSPAPSSRALATAFRATNASWPVSSRLTKGRADHQASATPRRDGTALACIQAGRLRLNEVADQEGALKNEQVAELLYQALETERGGIQVYTTALSC